MAKKATNKAGAGDGAITIEPVEMREVMIHVLGSTPLIMNKKSRQSRETLLLPAPPKNRAARAASVKHDPIAEYRESMYVDPDPKGSTLLVMPAPAFKGAAMTAALHVPGIAKAEVGRLFVLGYEARIYGIPRLLMSEVRQAGMTRAPDIRTRAIIPEWCCKIHVRYPARLIDPAAVANLFAAGGQLAGVGDFRQEKGKGSYGLFSLVNEDDPAMVSLLKKAGRQPQEAAFRKPKPYDDDTAELLEWFMKEVAKRGREGEITHAG